MGFKNGIHAKASPISGRYLKLSTDRNPYLERGQDYSRMTLPYLLPEDTSRSGADNQSAHQSVGARALNHLTNKVVMTLFPPQRPFFRAGLSELAKSAMELEGSSEVDVTEMLVSIERNAMSEGAKLAIRTAMIEYYKHLGACGNCLLYFPETGSAQAIPLSNYVVKRNSKGELIELIVMEEDEFDSFDPVVQASIKAAAGKKAYKEDDKVKLYTHSKLQKDGFFHIKQAAEDAPLGGEKLILPEKLPWIAGRWNTSHGEHYGRGLVEDMAGAFYALEFLSEARTKGMVLMADIKYIVKPGAVTDIQHLISSPSGEFISGNRDDITVLQLEKFADFTPIVEAIRDLEKQIGDTFLLSSASRRQAERVTAYELRQDALELETSLGGIYSNQAETTQKHSARLLLIRVDRAMGKDYIDPEILTGLESLGRAGDLDKIAQFGELISQTQTWPEPFQARIKWADFAQTIASGLSMKLPWVLTEVEFAEKSKQQEQAAQQQQLMEMLGKNGPKLLEQMQGGPSG